MKMVAFQRSLFCSTALATVMSVAIASGAHAQAVAYPNFTPGGFAGTNQGTLLGAGESRWTTPFGSMIGGQLDTIAGVAGGELMSQVAFHLFTRDPSTSLYGLYGAWMREYGNSAFRIGPEAEFYVGPLTVSGVGGVKFGDGSTDGFFQGKLNYYLDPDTKFYGGGGYEGGAFGMFGFEHMFQPTALSGFAEVRFGDWTAAWLGLRYYYGARGKSLKAREREDVAPLWLHLTKEPMTTVAPTTTAAAQQVAPTTTPAPTTTVAATTTPEVTYYDQGDCGDGQYQGDDGCDDLPEGGQYRP